MVSTGTALLESWFAAAVAAAHPRHCLPPHLPAPPPGGRVIVLAAGKAAGAMTEIAESHYLDACTLPPDRLDGLAVTRPGYARATRQLPVIEAGHPVPDEAGIAATLRTLALADRAGTADLVLVLLSGGASANWIAPAAGLSLADKQAVTRALLASGATIGEINTVRKHLSRIKGGRLAARISPARLVTITISDVPDDDPAVIGSGPTVADPTTLDEARMLLARRRIEVPAAVTHALADPANETPKPGAALFSNSSYAVAATASGVLGRISDAICAAGYDCTFLGARVEGEAREVAAAHAELARQLRNAGRRAVILSGGELTVTVRGRGRGGPNQEYMLALAIALDGLSGVFALAGDTDGIDGGAGRSDDPAGAVIDPSTLSRAIRQGLEPRAFLDANNSSDFFANLGDLLRPGPTCTNVSDFRAILVDSP